MLYIGGTGTMAAFVLEIYDVGECIGNDLYKECCYLKFVVP